MHSKLKKRIVFEIIIFIDIFILFMLLFYLNSKIFINKSLAVINSVEYENKQDLNNNLGNVIDFGNTDDKDSNIVSNLNENDMYLEKISSKYQSPNGEYYDVIANINIPSLNIDYPVLAYTSDELLAISLNKYWGSNPNEVGNCCILGHNYGTSKFFSNLPKIQLGDKIELTDLNGNKKIYTVYDTNVVEPDDTSCTSQLTNGRTEITLITCCDNGNKRFYAKAVCE